MCCRAAQRTIIKAFRCSLTIVVTQRHGNNGGRKSTPSGFKCDEVEPLIEGLQGKYDHPQLVSRLQNRNNVGLCLRTSSMNAIAQPNLQILKKLLRAPPRFPQRSSAFKNSLSPPTSPTSSSQSPSPFPNPPKNQNVFPHAL